MHRYTGVKNSFPGKYHTGASTTKRNVETSSRQSWANKTNCKPPSPPYILAYIHENPIRRKFQIIRGGRRKIYIYRDREYRFRATSIMEDSVQGSAIILQHPPLEPRPPRPLSSVIQSVYIYIYARYRSAAWRDGIPSPVNAGSLWKAFTIDAWPIVRLWDISIGGGYPHASKLRSRRSLLREAKPPII